MKATELRIGNLIEYRIQDDLDDRKDWWEVSKIDATDLCILESNIDYDFRPIPLTEEWLLKFGFERHDNGSVSAQFSYGINPVTQDYIIFLIWIKDYENDYQLNGFPFYQNGYFEIKTVHQLQNLYFYLTGKELVLKN